MVVGIIDVACHSQGVWTKEQDPAPKTAQEESTEGNAVAAKEEEVKEAGGSVLGTGSASKETGPDEDASRHDRPALGSALIAETLMRRADEGRVKTGEGTELETFCWISWSTNQLLLRVPSWYEQCMETNADSSEYYREDNMNHSQDEWRQSQKLCRH